MQRVESCRLPASPIADVPVSAADPTRIPLRRSLSLPGITTMLVGLSLIAMELRYQLLLDRIGMFGRVLVLFTGSWLSVWGLKEVIAAWWPGLGNTSMRRRHRFKMPIAGYVYVIVMIVLFVGSLMTQSNLMLVFALLAGPFIVNGGITFRMLRGLSVQRSVPRRVMAGEPFSVEVRLTNPKRWVSAWLMSVCDRVDNGREYLNPEILFARVRGRSTETGRYQLRLSQRGRYACGPLQVNSRFPLGLVERGLVLAERDEILVYPRIGRLSAGWRRRLQTATQLVSHSQARVGSFHDDFHRIREYRPGDEPRSIHWRTTARRNELMVREFRESRDRHLIVLLDAWVPERPTAADLQRVEYAISLAATIALDQMLHGGGSGVFFAMSGSLFRSWGGGGGTGDRNDLLDMLAVLQPSPRADIPRLLQAALTEQSPHSRTILVTGDRHRSRAVDWSAAASPTARLGPAVGEPPQVVIADPAEVGEVFTLDPSTPTKISTPARSMPEEAAARSGRGASGSSAAHVTGGVRP
jgi:uncharacterized protein (DUF58 family)